ncbi:hypothetical protein P171DRAFT_429641 [Karstenula rhodostoma CBS 690.94]|uniref:Uncharacterized protein n=1 Tax=Karstenula rhodostoma CBS 690.94 TaxID=1392251 RepID=A0A9P4PMV8_9PLEO|nr:hypothetical protein P171DRAFT_429641 [Karstenula rhodostoma CBS 690.94]
MRAFAILSGLALASATVLIPATQADKPGHLTYGDVQLDLKAGCQTVPQNKDDGLPKPSLLFTKLQVNGDYTCELYREPQCVEAFWTVDGPGVKAEYVDGWLFSAKCTANPRVEGRVEPSCGRVWETDHLTGQSYWLHHTGGGLHRFNFKARSAKVEGSCQCTFYEKFPCRGIGWTTSQFAGDLPWAAECYRC